MWQCPTATHCFGFDFEKMRSRVNFWRCWFQVIVRPWLGSRLTRSYSLVGIAPPVSCLIAPATSYAWPVPGPSIGCYANDRPSGGDLSCCHLRGRSWQESTNRKYQQIFVLRHLGRIHGISIAFMHQEFCKDYLPLGYLDSEFMAADIHTKAYPEHRASEWFHMRQTSI